VVREATTHPVLATVRLVLRPFRLDDVDAIHACYGDAEAMRFWDAPANASRVETERAVRRAVESTSALWRVWAVADGATDGCVGMVNYHNASERHRSADIGYIIRPDRQGQGVGREAVSALIGYCIGTMGLHRLQAFIHPENLASRRLVEGLGFRSEGVLRDALLVSGTRRDAVLYGLLAPEWGAGAGTA
jgi:ribosomal-protein-alanine N-acetyltransferase